MKLKINEINNFIDDEFRGHYVPVKLEEFENKKEKCVFFPIFAVFGILFCIFLLRNSRRLTVFSKPAVYVPAYEPFFDNISIRKNAFEKECYQFISGSYNNGTDKKNCYSHKPTEKYLSCHLGIAPSEAHIPRVIIIGSRGKVGRELVKVLKKNYVMFTEIKGSYHINADFGNFMSFLDYGNFPIMIDLSRPKIKDLSDLALSMRMKYIRLVDKFEYAEFFVTQLKIKEPFGNQYLKTDVSPFFRAIYDCINSDKCEKPKMNTSKAYNLASDIANEIYKILLQRPGEHVSDLDDYSEKEIWEALELFKNNALSDANPLFDIFNEMEEEKRKRETDIYYTQVFATKNQPDFVPKVQRTLDLYGKVFEQYPDISAEFIQFWVKSEGNLSFLDAVKIPPQLEKHFHVIEVSNDDYTTICNVLNISREYFPEYFFRDIGIRLGKGEFLVSGREDVYPPLGFFDIMQRKLDSPLAILRSVRKGFVGSVDDLFKKHYMKREDNPCTSIDTQNHFTLNDHYNFGRGDTDDLQGGPRRQVYELNGWPWGKWGYYADGAFLFDQTTFKAPYYEIKFAYTYYNNRVSAYKSAADYKLDVNEEMSTKFCAGYPSKDVEEYSRPNWGVSYDFKDEAKGKYGHLRYRIVPIVKKAPYVSNMEMFVTYNDYKNDYIK